MNFLDESGLGYFFKKIKAAFIGREETKPIVPITKYEYDRLTDEDKKKDVIYAISDSVFLPPTNWDGVPVGTVISAMRKTPPPGYLACDGSIYNIDDYPELSAMIFGEFGSFNHFGGDGETTFGVPDLRNLFLRGYHGEAEEKLSGEIGEKQEATEFPNIGVGTAGNWNGIAPPGVSTWIANYDKTLDVSDIPLYYHDKAILYNTERRALKHTSRPVNAAVGYFIKAYSPINGGESTYNETYSTTERRIGTWVDGRPLYRKTYVLENYRIPSMATSTSLNIPPVAEMDVLISSDALFLFGEICVPLNNTFGAVLYNGTVFRIYQTYTSKNHTGTLYVTLEYTKKEETNAADT